MFIVYKTTNLINGKIYIGVHDNKDIDGFDGYLGSGLLMLQAIKKHGKENFIRETLHTCSDFDTAFLLEEKLVTEEFIERKDTYNIRPGGKGDPSLGIKSMENKVGIFSDDYTEEIRRNNCKKAGKKSFDNKCGIFSDEYTYEMRSELSKSLIANMDKEILRDMCKRGGYKTRDTKVGIFSDEYTREKRAHDTRLKNTGCIYYNDGIKNYQYTKKQQEILSMTDFLIQNPQYKLGLHDRTYINRNTSLGSIWYNNGTKNYKYSKEQQETLSITEFMKNNPEYVLGKCRVNKQSELNN